MNYLLIIKMLGTILFIESLFLLPPLALSIYDNDGTSINILLIMVLMFLMGFGAMKIRNREKTITPKDGLFIVAFSWVIASIFGALPLYICTDLSYIDSFFEIVSGFTTTGASVIPNIELLPRSIVLWRSITHWLGGMGILVFTISLLPKLGVGGFQIYKAESPGPMAGKIESTMRQSAKRLYAIYLTITLILFLLLVMGGMGIFDSLIHTFGVVGTGGFSSKADSIMSYNSYYIPWVMTVFMVLCGTNFYIHYLLFQKKFTEIFKDEELRLYYIILLVSFIIITLDLYLNNYGNLAISARDGAFQISSIISTSGFANADYDLWPNLSKYILLILMFIGSCAGSTAGGFKIVRLVVLLKLVKRELQRVVHPKAVIPITLNGRKLKDEVVMGINSYFGIYAIVFVISVGIISISEIDLVSSISSVATMLSNVGPGFNLVGPTKNFASFGAGYKLYFSFLMLLGRLEFFTILGLISFRSRKKTIQ
ncbi:TrkH family potassium uptake protein [Anaerosphaera multitolerans]|uniref:TrkH family potassium uptake protein n=1 Tax=Anaerosphaera multitolerans TaxID=2487351 RepID=A0A437S5C8_9FIRM|nr:TrkH family potassium uptake protein [Anaerosphaera multitolerans]RVU54221.1 TrkH family potassium uptake protein [Anaerosphaera multitolerans]